MKVVSLISGGKDSCYNMMQCVVEGHELVALANLRPKDKDELDSYMYQTVGHHAIELYAEAMGLPLYRGFIDGLSKQQGSDYTPTEGDEVEDLYQLLKKVKDDLGVEAVSVGAILSNYQRVRVENVCSRLGLTPLAFLWRRNQEELLQEMIAAGVEAIIIKVAALGLSAEHLGLTLHQIQPHMMQMKEKYQLNVCGEGGEFETFTLDCPLFAKRINVKQSKVINHSDDAFAPVYYLNFVSMILEEKQNVAKSFVDRLRGIPMKRGVNIIQELGEVMLEDVSKSQWFSYQEGIPKQDENFFSHMMMDEVTMRSTCKTSLDGYMWVSGITAVETEETAVDLATEKAMECLKAQLGNHGYSLSDAVLVHLFVRDMSNFSEVNSVYRKYFCSNPPARVCVEVHLARNTILQIDCLAHRNGPENDCQHDKISTAYRHTMHVQSISHWAPANIGPYSQAVQIGDLIFSAGTIGLCPSTMQAVEGGILPQCALSLRSLQRVLAAMQPQVLISNVVGGVCYVTDSRHLNIAQKHWEEFTCRNTESSCSDINPVAIACHMMCYVVVPHLPKNVLVEWHIVASTSLDPWHYSRKSVTGEVSTSNLHMCLNSKTSSGWLICNTSLDTKARLELITRDLLGAVGSYLEKQHSWESTLCMRVFYKQSLSGHEQLLSALRTQLDKISTVCPICLVPVLSLSEPCAFTTLVFVQK